jgi:hypothetical protein
MDSAKLNDWIQVIGIFALVASLVFVGFQIRQEHDIARMMIYQERAASTSGVLAALAASEDFLAASAASRFGDAHAEVVVEGGKGPISVQQAYAGAYGLNAILMLTDNSHYQFVEGYLPESHWLGARNRLLKMVRDEPFIRRTLQSFLTQEAYYRPEFSEELKSIISEAEQQQ